MGDGVDAERLKRLVERRANSAAPLDRLRAAVLVSDELRDVGDQLLDGFVASARGAGCSWSEIGAVLGVSKQAAQQRFVAAGVAGKTSPADVTQPVRAAVSAAHDQARALGHNYVGTEHLLVGLLTQHEGHGVRALASLGITVDAVLAQTRDIVGVGCAPSSESVPITPRAKRAIELAMAEARRLGGGFADTEHLLLALVGVEDGLAAKILGHLGASPERVRGELARLLGVNVADLAPPVRRRRRLLQHR
jgi:hypothetical protein